MLKSISGLINSKDHISLNQDDKKITEKNASILFS